MSWKGYINKTLKDKNITDSDCACICDISVSAIIRWKTGITSPVKPMRRYLVGLLNGAKIKKGE